MRKRVLGLSASILLLGAAAADAQSEYGGEIGAYVGGAVFYANDTSSNEFEGDEDDIGVDVRAGLRLGTPVAIELQGDWNNGLNDFEIWTITTNFRVYYSELDAIADMFPDRLQLYAVGGVGVIGGDPEGDAYQLNGAFRMGAGVDFYLTEQLATSVGTEWITGTGFWSDSSYLKVGLGLQYNF